MSQIIPKLNLNKTPALVEDNSLIFAKNIRLDVDRTIHRDYGIFPMSIHKGKNTPGLVDYENILNKIISDIEYDCKTIANIDSYYTIIRNRLIYISGRNTIEDDFEIKNSKYKIVGIIPSSNEFYLFINGEYDKVNPVSTTHYNVSCIIRYDEKEDKFSPCNCNWNYSNGTITGCVINNLLGEKILNIGETNASSIIPLKCINLSKSTINDDEKIYTQTPNIPITNLNYGGTFNCVIPNGVYQFFVRYKIRDNFYTDWFPASKDFFAGNSNYKSTSFGGVKYTNTHRDSDTSFKFIVEHLFGEYTHNYQSFQIGFICSHDDEIVARAWKHFDFNIGLISFDYNAQDAYEIEITDLIKHTYQIYDVGNITSFKNKLYISNYKETDFNDTTLQTYANQVNIEIAKKEANKTYGGYTIQESKINGEDVIAGLIIDNSAVFFNGIEGIFNQLLNEASNYHDYNAKQIIEDSLSSNSIQTYNGGSKKYNVTCYCTRDNLDKVQTNHRSKFKDTANIKYTQFEFNNNITDVRVNNVSVGNNIDNILQAIYTQDSYLNFDGIFINANGIDAGTFTIRIDREFTYIRNIYLSGGLQTNDSLPLDIDEDKTKSNNNTLGRPDGIIIGNSKGNSKGTWESEPQTGFYSQYIIVKFSGSASRYINKDATSILNYTTLIPYQKYKFYIHYVKQNGETTNGYYCNGIGAGIKEIPYYPDANSVIYPKFNNIIIPSGYVACFFSILHVENNVSTLYNIENNDGIFEGNCIDINVGVTPGSNSITVKQDNIETRSAKYYYSSDSSNIRYFGADGIIQIKDKGFVKNNLAYVVDDYVISEAEDVQLIKCTPFIKKVSTLGFSFTEFANMNLLGYICQVYSLDRNRTINYYTDGSSIFLKNNVEKPNDNSDSYFKLLELKNHLGDAKNYSERITAMCLKDTTANFIYSNYNLNYITLAEEPVENYKSYYNGTSEETSEKATSAGSIVLRLFKSLTMSSIYELPAMYKTYTRKTYSTFKEDEITEFNNTVRSSELEGDESTINIFKFDANDYYNIPTNRGIIINMIGIGDAILVHTEDSMFKFSGSNTLQSSDGEIQPTENSVFDTGVSEVFGSDFGFAGLQNKTDSIVTELGYIFFDRDSRIVYMYSGQGQIVKVSETIEKLFRHKDISNIYFANDYYNNRFFMCVMFEENNTFYPVTLSFNINENIKSFVSLHDFYYYRAFNTKTKCYFLTDDNRDICTINKNYKGCYTKVELNNDKIYPSKLENKVIYLHPEDDNLSSFASYNIKSYDSIIDVICNTNFEIVKSLNSIKWSGNIVEDEFRNIDSNDITTIKMAEDTTTVLPCKGLRVYTDTCMTQLFDFTKISNNNKINSVDSYKYPRFNQGYWSYNYFRNIQNSNGNINPYVSDQNSLIEGRYFVTRFVFDTEFKFEDITFNYTNKI